MPEIFWFYRISFKNSSRVSCSKHAHRWISVTGGFTSTCRQRQWPWESSCSCPSHPPAQVRVASLRKSSNAVRSHTLPKSTAPATHGGQTCCHPASTGTDTILQSNIYGNILQHMLDLKKKKISETVPWLVFCRGLKYSKRMTHETYEKNSHFDYKTD